MLPVGNRNHQMGPAAVQPVMNQDSLFLPLLEVSKMRTLTWADSWKRSALPATTANLTHQRLSQSQSLTCQLQCVLHEKKLYSFSNYQSSNGSGGSCNLRHVAMWRCRLELVDDSLTRWRLVDSLTRCFDFDTLTAWIRTAHDSRIVGPPDSTILFSDKNERLGDSPPEDQLRLLKFGTMKF